MTETDIAMHVSVAEAPLPGVCTVRIRDSFLNYAMSDALKRSLKDLCHERISGGVRGFAVDLSPVTVMDSCGLSVLISVKKLVEGEGGRMSLFALSPMIRRLFAITKLDRVFEIHDDETSAVSALANA